MHYQGALIKKAIAFQFPLSVVTIVATISGFTKPEVFYWKLCLVSQKISPYLVISITVTAVIGVRT